MSLHTTDRGDGTTLIARTPDEEPFALLTAPRHRRDRRWGITYRSYGEPFGTCSHTSATNRTDALAQLERDAATASAYQLGLAPNP